MLEERDHSQTKHDTTLYVLYGVYCMIIGEVAMSERVIKYNGIFGTSDIEVHIVHTSRVTYMIILPLIDNTHSTDHN